MTDTYLYHTVDDVTGTQRACSQPSYGMITLDESKVNCASCKSILEGRKADAWNKKFEEQLWVFTAVNYTTGAESVLYGHATYNVFETALAQADAENSWLKTEKYVAEPEILNPFRRTPGAHMRHVLARSKELQNGA